MTWYRFLRLATYFTTRKINASGHINKLWRIFMNCILRSTVVAKQRHAWKIISSVSFILSNCIHDSGVFHQQNKLQGIGLLLYWFAEDSDSHYRNLFLSIFRIHFESVWIFEKPIWYWRYYLNFKSHCDIFVKYSALAYLRGTENDRWS